MLLHQPESFSFKTIVVKLPVFFKVIDGKSFYFVFRREDVRSKGLSVAIDARSAPKSAVEIIAESLQLLEVSFRTVFYLSFYLSSFEKGISL